MSRKHFRLVAVALRDARPQPNATAEAVEAWKRTVEAVLYALRGTGDFDADRFRDAVYILPVPKN